MIEKTEAIVLQTRKFSDSSKIVHLFSKEFGKISVIAKGAYSAKSSFGGCLEPLSYIHITFYLKSESNLHLLKTVELVKMQNKLNRNYNAIIVGLIVAEFILTTQNEHFECKKLFDYSINFLENLNLNTSAAYHLCIKYLIYLSENMGFSVLNHQASSNILEVVNKLHQTTENEIHLQTFVDIINYFASFFSEQLGKKINIKSIFLLM